MSHPGPSSNSKKERQYNGQKKKKTTQKTKDWATGIETLIHQSGIRIYTKVVLFNEIGSFHFENIKFNGKNKIGNWKSIYKDLYWAQIWLDLTVF